MTVYWYGVEWGEDRYFFWFDLIENPYNKLLGYEKLHIDGKWHHMLCFWWFCVAWSIR